MINEGDPEPDAAALVGQLAAQRLTMGCAESLTAGLVAARLGAVSGVSEVLLGAIVAYSAAIKVRLLGVRESTIATHGVVSEQVAREMAAGARRALQCDVAVSTTGVAGPGPHEGVDAGTVCLAVAHGGRVDASTLRSGGDREQVRQAATAAALAFVWRATQQK